MNREPPPLKAATHRAIPLPVQVWAAAMAVVILITLNKTNSTPANGLVFNDMLLRLLQGRFDVSPAVIGTEGFVHGGKTYAYFGVFCALLRLPLLLTGKLGVDMTKTSMLLAEALSLGARLAAADRVISRARGVSRELRLILLGALAFGGETLQYLEPSIFQEVCTWGAALASVFVLLAVTRMLEPTAMTARLYAAMALVAGLALLCRVSFGLGLYAALGAMLCVEGWRARHRLASLRALAPAALILAVFLAAAGGINQARWGDPLAFVPIQHQSAQRARFPDRVFRLDHYGEANLRRAPFALQYYFAPIWTLRDGSGKLLFQQTQLDLFDAVELPPSSLLLSDPVVCLLAALGLWQVFARRKRPPERPAIDRALAGGALLGLALPAAAMLTAITLTFRYRMDFYPLLDLAAFVGLATLRLDPVRQPTRPFLYLGLGGAMVALCSLMLYGLAPFGPALDLDMRGGWLTPMLESAHGHDPFIGHLMPDGRRLDVPQVGGGSPSP